VIGSAVENPVSLVSCVGVRCFTCCFKLESRLPPSPLGFFVCGTEIGFLSGIFGRVSDAFFEGLDVEIECARSSEKRLADSRCVFLF
jgi:hypothetical protein